MNNFRKLVLLFVLTFIFTMNVSAATFKVYTVKYKCPIRVAAGEDKANLLSGTDKIQVYPNQEVEYISSAKGLNNGNKNAVWYAVRFDYAAREYTGYVAEACMNTPKSYSYSDDTAFEEKIKSFPESYKPYLRKLHAIHPNWNFKMDKTNLDWEDSVEAESTIGTSSISSSYPSLKFTNKDYPNGIVIDGYSWYAPAKQAVAYYMDPRNFLNERNMFMFETLSYDANQDSSVEGILKNSFMSGTFKDGETNKTYVQAFIDAAKQTNVSSIHLASRSLQEMGTTMSSAASGTVKGYEGYYNFYNIGAYSGEDNYLKGLEYAKNKGWDSVQKAITGGAEFIASGYIAKGQDTMYYQKYNVSSSRKYNAYSHQYMTNIMAPYSESSTVYSTYSSNGKLNNTYTFTIPVFESMPNTAVKVSKTDTIGGTEEDEEVPKEEEKEEIKVTPEEKITKSGLKITSGYITGIKLGTDMSTIRKNLEANSAVVASSTKDWKSKTSGKIATGDRIEVDGKSYQIAISGDVSGDGEITIKDLLLVQKNILGSTKLDGTFKLAGDVSKDNSVTIKDLLLVQKHILGSYKIEG